MNFFVCISTIASLNQLYVLPVMTYYTFKTIKET